MYVVLVQVTVRGDALAEFEPAILTNAAAARTTEAGCLRFDVCQSDADPTAWMFYEVYRDRAAFEAHRQSAHFKTYQAVAERVLLSKVLTTYHLRATGDT